MQTTEALVDNLNHQEYIFEEVSAEEAEWIEGEEIFEEGEWLWRIFEEED